MPEKIYIAEFDAENKLYMKKLADIEGKTQKTMSKLESTISSLGKTMMASFGTYQVLNFANKSIESFMEQEKAITKLNTALGRNTRGLQQWATDMQKVTTFGDEQTLSAMSRIAAFTKEESVIKKITKASMDLATAKGVDLESAADMITKTFTSSTNVFKKWGINVTGAADSTERLNSVLSGLSIYSGQAEEMGKSLSGQFEILKNQVNELEEDVGQRILPIYVELLKDVKETYDWWSKFLGLTKKENVNNIVPDWVGGNKFGVGNGKTVTVVNKTDQTTLTGTTPKIEGMVTIELQKQYDIMEDIYELRKEMDDQDTILEDYKDPSGRAKGKYGPAGLGDAGKAFQRSIEETQNPMNALVSLSNQMASNFSFAGHTFVGQLSQALAMTDSISNIILTIATIFGSGGGGFGLGGLLSLIGLEKGGRISGAGRLSKIPSFASGGTYSTPPYAGSFGGGYPVLVHKNETLDVYNSGQTSKMERKLDSIRNAIVTSNIHLSKKNGGQPQVISINLDGKKLFEAVAGLDNRASRAGKNRGEII